MATKAQLGPPIVWSDSELDELAEVTTQSIQDVNAAWREEVPRWARNILIAQPTLEGDGADST